MDFDVLGYVTRPFSTAYMLLRFEHLPHFALPFKFINNNMHIFHVCNDYLINIFCPCTSSKFAKQLRVERYKYSSYRSRNINSPLKLIVDV